ncbi:alcohol dehydrogenase catalytic domain-containing protein [Bradyrhizobium guangdongense]|uniref:alcohol dehydrogenase catalytic domain-containing protein n=1 Tax=Bradyrhizobium guangdongense TaxID=1325090 RepID=UPI00131A3B60|nr:alcohol dehydrogenase catalytic domain-containing protein [Bradyrhizobium guangdongense]
MLAVVAERTGPPDVLRVADIVAREPGPGEIRIAVAACGVCFHDIVVRNGTYRRDVAMPVILGHEVAGAVEKLGQGVGGLQCGDLVATTAYSHVCGYCRHCRGGHETSCPDRVFLGDAGLNGGYAELVCVDADAVQLIPPGVSAEEASIVACTIGTELNAVRDVGRVQTGDRVLVTGAGGGLGLHGVQLSRLAGAFTIAVTTSKAKAARIREAGADEVIVVERGREFSAEVRRLTNGRGVDVAIDNVGSPVFETVRRSMADDGRIVVVGQVTGDFITVNPAQLFLRNVSILSAKGVSRSQLADALELVARRRIRPVVEDVRHLHDAAAAHRVVEAGLSSGRIVLSPVK